MCFSSSICEALQLYKVFGCLEFLFALGLTGCHRQHHAFGSGRMHSQQKRVVLLFSERIQLRLRVWRSRQKFGRKRFGLETRVHHML